MEKCYSNLLHDSGKGLLSLILSLIGLNVRHKAVQNLNKCHLQMCLIELRVISCCMN